jgi:hypothetical protein
MSESTTESGILNSIPDIGAGGAEGDSGHSSGVGGSADGGSDSGGRSSAAPAPSGQGEQQSAGPQQQAPVQRRHDGLLEVPNQQHPNTRDLVDPVTGRVVAQGGIERRVYEEGQRHARENAQLKQQLQAFQQHVQGTDGVIREAQQLGIGPEQHSVALRVMADFQKDPVRTLEYLVNEVRAKGYNIPFLQQGTTPGMDMEAFSRMIDAKLQPFTSQQQLQQRHAQAQAAAKQQLDQFIAENPAVNSNLDVIGEMFAAQPNLSLDRAWSLLIQWAATNGLDWRQPLKAQIAARQQQPTQQQSPAQTRPLPGSRSAGNGAIPRADANGQYSENSSWSDIIRGAMHESGMLQH